MRRHHPSLFYSVVVIWMILADVWRRGRELLRYLLAARSQSKR